MNGSLEVRQLRYFVEVARRGSINTAAIHLHIAQSALSRRMRLLESDVGAELLIRRPKGVTLTPLGHGLFERAESLLRTVDNIEEYLQSQIQSANTHLRVGIAASTCFLFQDQLLERIRTTCPRLVLHISEGTSTHLIERLRAGELDLALTTNPSNHRSLSIVPIWQETLALIHSADQGTIASLEDLAHLPFVLTTHSEGVRDIFEKIFAQSGLTFRIDLEMESLNSVKPLVASGRAYTILPYYAVIDEVESGRLRANPIPDASISRAIVFRSSIELSYHAQLFIELIRAYLYEKFQHNEWFRPFDT